MAELLVCYVTRWSIGDRQNVRRGDRRIEPHVVRLPPAVLLASELVGDGETRGDVKAEGRAVQPDSRLPRLVRIEVYHHDHGISAAPRRRDPALGETEDLRVIGIVEGQVAELGQGGAGAPGAARAGGRRPSPGAGRRTSPSSGTPRCPAQSARSRPARSRSTPPTTEPASRPAPRAPRRRGGRREPGTRTGCPAYSRRSSAACRPTPARPAPPGTR